MATSLSASKALAPRYLGVQTSMPTPHQVPQGPPGQEEPSLQTGERWEFRTEPTRIKNKKKQN